MTARVSEAAIPNALNPSYYLDETHFRTEMSKVWHKTWQYACHSSEIPEKGSYVTIEIGGQNMFVLRGAKGEVRCFYNVCMHRAHELLEGTGKVRNVTCPYHAWAYSLDGKLVKARNADRVPGFDGSKICLTEVKTEIFLGFVFVNLDTDAKPMADWYPGVEAELREFVPHIDQLRPIRTVVIPEDCNWKVSVDNYSECYHCKVTHPTFTSGVVDPATYKIRPQGYCLRHTTKGVQGDKMSYRTNSTSPHAADYSSWFLWPGFSFQVYPGSVLNTYRWIPKSAGHVIVERGWYTIDGIEDNDILGLADLDRATTVAEDLRLVNSVQRGLASKGYAPGPLMLDQDSNVDSEHAIHAMNQWLKEHLEDATSR